MISLIKFLFETTPRNPDTIIIQNEFYPSGLTEKDIYSYYMKSKSKILNQVNNRDLMIFFATDKNKFIVRRIGRNLDRIHLDKHNYEKVINGRTVSIHSTMESRENFGIIDIDCADFAQARESAAEIYDFLLKYNKNLKIRYTGKESFHIFYYFGNTYDIGEIRDRLKGILLNLKDKKYLINRTRTPGKVNLDLSSNKFRGGYITLHSLSVFGLRCMEVNRQDLLKFQKEDAKLR